jgi:hypothetical protein
MSARIDYHVDKLREAVTEKRDKAILEAEEKYAKDSDLAGQRETWRIEQEKRVKALARRIKDVPDNELGSFAVPACPANSDHYYRRSPKGARAEAIEKAEDDYARRMRRLDAVRSDAGVISLTPNMLREFFGL